MENIIERAKSFAFKAHKGQVRKYTGNPYIDHPYNVAMTISERGYSHEMVAAAWLHDVVEDCGISLGDIYFQFGAAVCVLVEMLTDVSVKGDGNRKQRKANDLAHTALASPQAKTIKLADIYDNLHAMPVETNAECNAFSKTYFKEIAALLEVLKDGDAILWQMTYDRLHSFD